MVVMIIISCQFYSREIIKSRTFIKKSYTLTKICNILVLRASIEEISQESGTRLRQMTGLNRYLGSDYLWLPDCGKGRLDRNVRYELNSKDSIQEANHPVEIRQNLPVKQILPVIRKFER